MSLRAINHPRFRMRAVSNEHGLTLLEVMIAAIILLFVLLSMVSGYTLGRVNLDREEVKRRAIGLAQDRLEEIRARSVSSFDGFDRVTSTAVDTTYTVDGTDFTLTSAVVDSPATGPNMKTVSVDVSWTVKRQGGDVTRAVRSVTYMARDITP